MKTAASFFSLTFLFLIAPQAYSQETTFGKVEAFGRSRHIEVHVKAGAIDRRTTISWKAVTTPGELLAFGVVTKSNTETLREVYDFLGSSETSLRLRMNQKALDNPVEVIVPMHNGAFYFYPAGALLYEIGFKITPHKPKPGMFEVELIRPDAKKPVAEKD